MHGEEEEERQREREEGEVEREGGWVRGGIDEKGRGRGGKRGRMVRTREGV